MARKKKAKQFDTLETVEPQKIKKFHKLDLNHVSALTNNQKKVFNIWNTTDKHLFLSGFAGVGKSFLSIYLALNSILTPESPYDKIVIIRAAVPTRSQGYVPGELSEKEMVYQTPYLTIFDQLFKYKKSFENLKETGKIEFCSTSYLRGITLDNAIIIFDEAASATWHEVKTVLSRVGTNSRVVIIADDHQNDLIYKRNEETGYYRMEKVLQNMESVERISFTLDDVVRSGFCKEFLIADYNTSEVPF